jgi:predicted kinase
VPRASIVIITGPPGSGKTTVARLVAQRFERGICLESDWFWTTIVTGFISPWKAEADRQNRVIVRSCAAAAAAMAAGGYAVVLDGIIGPWNLDIATAEFAARHVSADYVVLRPTREIALRRATARVGEERIPGHPALTDAAAIVQMWDQFSDLGEYEQSVVDNSEIDPDQTALLVWNRMSRGS